MRLDRFIATAEDRSIKKAMPVPLPLSRAQDARQRRISFEKKAECRRTKPNEKTSQQPDGHGLECRGRELGREKTKPIDGPECQGVDSEQWQSPFSGAPK